MTNHPEQGTLFNPEPEGWKPYADGTSGHQGDTSEEAEPKRRKAMRPALDLIARRGPQGLTWYELGRLMNTHHGSASGALSNLHRSGLIVRLAERRGGSSVYVLRQHVGDRAVIKYGKRRAEADQ